MQSASALLDLVSAMPLIRDPNQRASLYPKIAPLLEGLPNKFATSPTKGKAVEGRFVRIELPGQLRALTLAEVEVYSDGRNIPRQRKAPHENTAHGDDAAKPIHGTTSSNH